MPCTADSSSHARPTSACRRSGSGARSRRATRTTCHPLRRSRSRNPRWRARLAKIVARLGARSRPARSGSCCWRLRADDTAAAWLANAEEKGCGQAGPVRATRLAAGRPVTSQAALPVQPATQGVEPAVRPPLAHPQGRCARYCWHRQRAARLRALVARASRVQRGGSPPSAGAAQG